MSCSDLVSSIRSITTSSTTLVKPLNFSLRVREMEDSKFALGSRGVRIPCNDTCEMWRILSRLVKKKNLFLSLPLCLSVLSGFWLKAAA